MDLTQIETAIDNGKLFYIQKLFVVLTSMRSGCGSVTKLLPLKRLIKALEWQVPYFEEGVDNPVTDGLYSCILQIIGSFNQPYVIDPTVVIPGQTVIVVPDGAVPVKYYYDEGFLVDAGGGNYYLPFKKPDGSSFTVNNLPILVTINGVSFTWTYLNNVSPPRIYGFASNDPQTIEVTVL